MLVQVSKLKPHPQNTYFFDDMAGESWEKFLKSIKERGIKEPIIITQDNMIVSGHQRIRAAKELGIQSIDAIQNNYSSDDEILLDLIELNIRQRGIMADSETKAGRRFKELKRIYGVRHGGDRKSSGQLVQLKTGSQLAEELHTTQRQMDRTIQVSDADPILQQLNIDGKISGDTVRYIMSKLSEKERNDFYINNEDVAKIRKRDVEEYIASHKQPEDYDHLKSQVSSLSKQLKDKEEEVNILLDEIDNANNEVPDFSANDINQKYEDLHTLYNKEVTDYQSQISTLRIELDNLRRTTNPVISDYKDGDAIYEFCNECNKFVTKIVTLQYSDAFRKISADRTLPLDSLSDSCAKVMDALQELIKHTKTDSFVDSSYSDTVNTNIVDSYVIY